MRLPFDKEEFQLFIIAKLIYQEQEPYEYVASLGKQQKQFFSFKKKSISA